MIEWSRIWNRALRRIIFDATGLPEKAVLRAGQIDGLTTPQQMAAYDLTAMDSEPWMYTAEPWSRVNYSLQYMVYFYGEYAADMAAALLRHLQTQPARDILYPCGLRLRRAQQLSCFYEYINGAPVRRADVQLSLYAGVVEPRPGEPALQKSQAEFSFK